MKRIAILGATGSIGMSALDVVRTHSQSFKVVALAVRTQAEKGLALAREFGAEALAVEDANAARAIESEAANLGVRIFAGGDAATRLVEEVEADEVLVSVVGMSGLAPTIAAIKSGRTIALATKEVMVAAGELVTDLAARKNVRILPVDSEHSAIFQCLQRHKVETAGRWSNLCDGEVDELILTASGGPFLKGPADLSTVTPAQALNHPRWKMGPKVTVDSSTMMNKGFEILEARWLFNMPVSRIKVVVHPESIVHSLVTFRDGATLAQLSPPDMRVPIQYALTWPERLEAERARLDLPGLASLNFMAPDEVRFPCLRLVREAAEAGGTYTAALSAADEIAVSRFLRGEISYTDIARLISHVLAGREDIACDSFENVLAADADARRLALEFRKA